MRFDFPTSFQYICLFDPALKVNNEQQQMNTNCCDFCFIYNTQQSCRIENNEILYSQPGRGVLLVLFVGWLADINIKCMVNMWRYDFLLTDKVHSK